MLCAGHPRPVGAHLAGQARQALLIGVGILDDQPGDPFRVPGCQPSTSISGRLGSADGEIDLAAVQAFRAHIAAAVAAARAGQPPPGALRAITAALRNAPAYQELSWNGELVTATLRRRWCSPTVCGNRARVARYYQRHKD